MRATLFLTPLLLLACGTSASGTDEKRPTPVTDAQRDTAIQRGVRYLERSVPRLPEMGGTPRKQFTVAVSGLVHLLASDRGKRSDGRADPVREARRYLAKYLEEVERRTADRRQLPDHAGMFHSGRVIQYTWPVALAGVFFAEASARGQGGSEARTALKRARILLRRAQDASGGWGHHRTNKQAGRKPAKDAPAIPGFPGIPRMAGSGYPDTLVSSSFVVASALGLIEGKPQKEAPAHLQRATAYFRTAQLSNGNFPYDPSQRSAQRSLNGVSRTAGAAFALWTLGVPWKDKALATSLTFVDEHFDYLNEGHGSSTLNLLYGALLQKTRGPRAWKRFKARYFRPILDKQADDGACQCICEMKAFGATNDSDPFAKSKAADMPGGVSKRVTSSSGDPGMLKKLMQGGTDAYVSSLHTLILLLDRTSLRLLGGKRPKPAAADPVTPR